jgi:hypothetical protein
MGARYLSFSGVLESQRRLTVSRYFAPTAADRRNFALSCRITSQMWLGKFSAHDFYNALVTLEGSSSVPPFQAFPSRRFVAHSCWTASLLSLAKLSAQVI